MDKKIYFKGQEKPTEKGGNNYGGVGAWFRCWLTAEEMTEATKGKKTFAGFLEKKAESNYYKAGWYVGEEKINTLNREIISYV